MTAMEIARPGGPDSLQLVTCDVPRPGAGEVLIKVAFAGVNRPDIFQREGNYAPPEGASPLPGLEVAGEIAAIGDDVDALAIGDRICALVPGGGYAEYCLVPAGHCLPVPESLSLKEAAALPETLFTVWHNVFERGWVKEGDTLLVHGGTSGIGTMATMLGKLFGLTVFVTCGSEDKCARAREIGADHAINYKQEDFVERVRTLTGGKGVDCVLDMVAGDYTPRNLKALSVEGRLVTIAVLGGAKATINMAQLMMRRQTITGSTLRARSDEFKTLLAQEIAANVWPLVEDGSLRPVMDRSFALSDAPDAHRHMEAGDHIGKIVLEVHG
ncbi:NAD(P)H-quinone oxidoreductase [Altericroceibacterium endophyticum]